MWAHLESRDAESGSHEEHGEPLPHIAVLQKRRASGLLDDGGSDDGSDGVGDADGQAREGV